MGNLRLFASLLPPADLAVVVRRHEESIEDAEDRGEDEVHLLREPGHTPGDDCWCEPSEFKRPSGLSVFVHRRLQ